MNVALSHCMDVYYLSFINQLLVLYRPPCLTFVQIWAGFFSIRTKYPSGSDQFLSYLLVALSASLSFGPYDEFSHISPLCTHIFQMCWTGAPSIRTKTFSMTKNRSSFSCAESTIENGLLAAYRFFHFNTLSLANANKSKKKIRSVELLR